MWNDKRRREVREEKVEKMNGKVVGWGIVLALVLSVALGAFLVSVSAQSPVPQPPKPSYIVLTADPSEIAADGSATSTINASAWVWNDDWQEYVRIAVIPEHVTFSTDLGEITESAQIINDTATAILTAGTEPGVANITAKLDAEAFGLATNTTTVTFITPGDGGDDNGGNGGGSSSSGSGGGTTTTPTPTVLTSPGTTPTPASTEASGPTAGATTPGPAVTSGATQAPTTTTTETPASATPTPKQPGFGAVFALTGLLAVAYLLMWKRN